MKKQLIALGVCALAVVAVACSEDVDMGEFRDGGPPSFTPTDGGEGGLPNIPLTCMGTVCPEGMGTCLSGKVGVAPHKCGTNLRNDADNCGACGNKCGEFFPLHMTSRCVDATCQIQCYSEPVDIDASDWRNCNGKLADGCEIDVNHDRENCGSCGNVCPTGSSCFEGKCGCPTGFTECDGRCVDLKTEFGYCGACDHSCWSEPEPCSKRPPHTTYACQEGTCGHIVCQDGWVDCNRDLETGCASDGCEAPAGVENCGTCGKKCNAEESCITEGEEPHCGFPCIKYGKVLCSDDRCYDLLNDVNACGACGIGCPNPGPNSKRTCVKGVCGLECLEGFADCNGDPADGCEVDLRVNPDNCGTCGNRCNVGAGQPCIDGKCLMVECTAPGAK